MSRSGGAGSTAPARNGTILSDARLVEIYESSVGRAATLLLNVPPSKRGKIEAVEVQRLENLGAYVSSVYGTNLASHARIVDHEGRPATNAAALLDGDDETVWLGPSRRCFFEAVLDPPAEVDRVSLKEAIQFGQRVGTVRIHVQEPGDELPRQVARVDSLGYRRVIPIRPTRVARMRVEISESSAIPVLSAFSLHSTSSSLKQGTQE